jgi:alkylation response protein AidB-like acyl-CoA dehydrogenase
MGLPISYQRAFDAESRDYEMPIILNTPTFTICAATTLDTGTDGQKRDRISAAIRGDEVLVQLLSEPSGGSDLAGVITRADRRGEKWIVNGAKTWSTSAFAADYGLLLARTDWNVPKHEGLTMFLVPINSPGITMRRIMQVDGGNEFASGTGAEGASDQPVDYVALLEATGQTDNERIREQAGRALVHRAVQKQLVDHVYHGVLDGSLPPAAGSIIRITHAETVQFEIDTALAIAGTGGVVDDGTGLFSYGDYPSRQGASLGGGTTEIARNIIGERILGFPREHAPDRGVPFNRVKRKRD